MRNYDKESLKHGVCNRCGHVFSIEKEQLLEERCRVTMEWGYLSKKDGEIHSFDLCETCYDEWIETFSIPVRKKEKVEWI